LEIQYSPPKVEVVITLGFDDDSEKALQIAWKVAQKILDEYGVWVEVLPVHVWIHDPVGFGIPDLPRIEVNGKVVAIGRVPDEEEFIDIILSRVFTKEKPEQDIYALAAIQKNTPVFEEGAGILYI